MSNRDDALRRFEALDAPQKTALRRWYATQATIITSLAVDEALWFSMIAWALQNPGDMSFVDAVTSGRPLADDAPTSGPERAVERQLLGVELHKNALEGDRTLRRGRATTGLDQELHRRFRLERDEAQRRHHGRRAKKDA